MAGHFAARGYQTDFVPVPILGADADSLVAAALQWRAIDLHRVGPTRVDLVVCGDPAAAFVRHPTLVLWLERDDHGTEGAATMSLPAKDTPAGRLTAAAITGVATIVVGSCDDAADLERRFGVDRDRVKLAAEYLSALPVLGVGDGHEPAAHGPEGQG